MSRMPAVALLMACMTVLPAGAQQPVREGVRPASRPSGSGDALGALRIQFDAEIGRLMPRLRAAQRAAEAEDSLKASDLPLDTLRVGALHFRIDRSQLGLMQESLTPAWQELARLFGSAAQQLDTVQFVARLRPEQRSDTSRKVIDLAELHPGRLDIFDRVRAEERPDVIGSLIAARGAKIILQNSDSTLRQWLVDPLTWFGLLSGAKADKAEHNLRERMHADLMTAPSQVVSRCIAGDLRRCRDALGLIPTADPLTEWYNAEERRSLVARMREILAKGSHAEQFASCVDGRALAVCDRLLRTIPRYNVPPGLPSSARHHLFRIALNAGGTDAFARMVAGPGSMEERLSSGARMPIDSVVSRWRDDVLQARPASPEPSLLSIWTAVGWGLAVMLLSLRFASWR